jgi:hypothetical protein
VPFGGAPARQGDELAQVAVAAPSCAKQDHTRDAAVAAGSRQEELAADDEVDAALPGFDVRAHDAGDKAASSVSASDV